MDYITDNLGKHKVIEQKNGIKIKKLVEPSEWYKEKQKKISEKETQKRKKQIAEEEREKKIKAKIREIAIRELEG